MMNPTDDFLPADLAGRVEAELAKGERIAWIGRPIPWLRARSAIPLMVFGVPFTGFALFWIAATSGFWFPNASGPVPFFALFGIPFLLVGLGLLTSPFWMYRRAIGTIYAITDRRALAIEPTTWGRTLVRSFEPALLGDLVRTQNADGSGDLVFRREYHRNDRHGRLVDFGFLAVPDVRAVEDHVRELASRADRPAGEKG